MKKLITRYTSQVHGRVRRTTLWRGKKSTEKELSLKLSELLHNAKDRNVVGCGFHGDYCYIEEKVR